MQLTDLHWVESDSYKLANDSTYNLIREMMHIEHPDLVILTGDIVVSSNAIKGWERLANLFEKEKTPFAVTFGNHDCESDMPKEQVLKYLKTNPYNMTYDAENGKLSGSGNCSLPIMSSDGTIQKWALYLFDSHNIIQDRSFGYYDWVKHDQIEWYRKTRDQVIAHNKRKLPSLAFFHIPFPEYETARWSWREFGEKQEGVSAPSLNSGLFYAFIEKKDVIGVFTGHDHNNDYMIDLGGNIALAYGRKTGYPSAYNEVLSRGVRVINLNENENSFTSYIRDLKGTYSHYVFEQKNKGTNIPRFNGSFIQEYLVTDWKDERWDQEMVMLREAGMKYLIYAPALLTDEKGKSVTYYPSSLTKKSMQKNTIEKCLRSAHKYGIKVFLGLNFNERWWKVDYDSNWLIDQMKIGNKVADELVALYKEKYKSTMYGWYWVWEVDNLNCMTAERQEILAKALNTNLDYLSKIAPDMPFMMSPFMNEKVGGSADEYRKMWENVFAKTHFRVGDIFSPQDCIGAGGLTLDHLEEWFSKLKQAVNTKAGLKFWGNIETFDQRFWVSAPLTRIQKQLDIVNGYVSNLICFAYSHYESPYVVDKEYHDSYLKYCKDGNLPKVDIPEKVLAVTIKETSRGWEVRWIPRSINAVAGYSIYRNGTLCAKLQVTDGNIPTVFFDKEANVGCIYEIAAYNVLGEESEKVKAE
nr:DUF4434 domain-containing protein [uncultured Bacteroides sp.]